MVTAHHDPVQELVPKGSHLTCPVVTDLSHGVHTSGNSKWWSQLWRCKMILFSCVFSSFPSVTQGGSCVFLPQQRFVIEEKAGVACKRRPFLAFVFQSLNPLRRLCPVSLRESSRRCYYPWNPERQPKEGIYGNEGKRGQWVSWERGKSQRRMAAWFPDLINIILPQKQQKQWTQRDRVHLDNGCLRLNSVNC